MPIRRLDPIERWRRGALASVLALTLVAPGSVYPCTIDQLLSLPLECLLQIEFTPPGAPPRAVDCGMTVSCAMTVREAK